MSTTTPTHPLTSSMLEPKAFKTELDSLLTSFIARERQHYETITKNPSITTLFTHLEAVCQGGKRLRPYLVYRLYAHTHQTAALDDLKELLLAIELFHIFCLIHDDIMDEAPLRHSVPTLHHFASEQIYGHITPLSHARRTSESQAILMGDMVFNIVFKLLTAATRHTIPNTAAIQDVFHTLVEEVCLGQMLDVDLTTKNNVTEASIIEKNRLKTAYYSFARPLHIGALVSGREDLIPTALTFGEEVGLLYQIQDDLLDVLGDAADTHKEPFQDVTQNQHTVLTAYVREHGGEAAALLDRLTGHPLSKEDKAALRTAFIETGAVAHAQGCIANHAQRATESLALLPTEDQPPFLHILALLNGRTT